MSLNKILLAVAIAATVVGAVWAVQYFGAPSGSMAMTMGCAKPGCGWTGDFTLTAGAPYPPKCPKCGEQTVFRLCKCPKCGNRQHFNEEIKLWLSDKYKEIKSLPDSTQCKNCGGPIRHENS